MRSEFSKISLVILFLLGLCGCQSNVNKSLVKPNELYKEIGNHKDQIIFWESSEEFPVREPTDTTLTTTLYIPQIDRDFFVIYNLQKDLVINIALCVRLYKEEDFLPVMKSVKAYITSLGFTIGLGKLNSSEEAAAWGLGVYRHKTDPFRVTFYKRISKYDYSMDIYIIFANLEEND